MAGEDADFDARLDAVLIGGREERDVVIVEYSPDWPVRFEAEKQRIQAALGPVARRVEHVGSTSVPGLAAKPVVDVLVTVSDPDDEAAYGPALEAAGYVLRVREPGHRMFRTPEGDVHVHVWPAGGRDERRQLVFRDRLRSNHADRAEYERAKRELAGRWPDMNYYARAKGPVIDRILARAGPGPEPGRGQLSAGAPVPRGTPVHVSDFTKADVSPPKLPPDRLRAEQEVTLATPRRTYGVAARALFVLLDVVYGRARTLSKFKVLEVIARVPYQAWEQVAYVAVTHRYSRPRFARRIFDRVGEARSQQDNEQWHLLILEDLVERSGKRESFVRYRVFPQLIALAYYHLSWALYVLRPAWSYQLNVDFEDHAEHEYALLVQEHPEWEDTLYEGPFTAEYGSFASLADLFRQIGHDERVHKLESLARMSEPRFV